jgi:hypothetical protein
VIRYAFVTRLRERAAAEPDRPKRQTVTLPGARHAVRHDWEVYVALLLRAVAVAQSRLPEPEPRSL